MNDQEMETNNNKLRMLIEKIFTKIDRLSEQKEQDEQTKDLILQLNNSNYQWEKWMIKYTKWIGNSSNNTNISRMNIDETNIKAEIASVRQKWINLKEQQAIMKDYNNNINDYIREQKHKEVDLEKECEEWRWKILKAKINAPATEVEKKMLSKKDENNALIKEIEKWNTMIYRKEQDKAINEIRWNEWKRLTSKKKEKNGINNNQSSYCNVRTIERNKSDSNMVRSQDIEKIKNNSIDRKRKFVVELSSFRTQWPVELSEGVNKNNLYNSSEYQNRKISWSSPFQKPKIDAIGMNPQNLGINKTLNNVHNHAPKIIFHPKINELEKDKPKVESIVKVKKEETTHENNNPLSWLDDDKEEKTEKKGVNNIEEYVADKSVNERKEENNELKISANRRRPFAAFNFS